MTGHLVHIGYPKTGSNFLRRWFSAHPELAFVEGGIAGCRDVYEFVREIAAPTTGIRFRVTSSEVFAIPHAHAGDPGADIHGGGPIDVSVSQARACEELRGLFPNAHILIVTRGFESMMRSGLSQFVRVGGDPARLSAELIGNMATVSPWHYDRLAGLYRKAFPGRVLLLPYELLRDNPQAFVGEVERSLGLAHWPPPPGRDNVALGAAEMRWYPMLSRVVRGLPVGERLRAAIFRRYVRLARANRLRALIRLLDAVARPSDPPKIDANLVEAFRGSAESLRGHPLYAPYAEDYLL